MKKGWLLAYLGKRIERRGLSVKEEERREKKGKLVILRIFGEAGLWKRAEKKEEKTREKRRKSSWRGNFEKRGI